MQRKSSTRKILKLVQTICEQLFEYIVGSSTRGSSSRVNVLITRDYNPFVPVELAATKCFVVPFIVNDKKMEWQNWGSETVKRFTKN